MEKMDSPGLLCRSSHSGDLEGELAAQVRVGTQAPSMTQIFDRWRVDKTIWLGRLGANRRSGREEAMGIRRVLLTAKLHVGVQGGGISQKHAAGSVLKGLGTNLSARRGLGPRHKGFMQEKAVIYPHAFLQAISNSHGGPPARLVAQQAAWIQEG